MWRLSEGGGSAEAEAEAEAEVGDCGDGRKRCGVAADADDAVEVDSADALRCCWAPDSGGSSAAPDSGADDDDEATTIWMVDISMAVDEDALSISPTNAADLCISLWKNSTQLRPG